MPDSMETSHAAWVGRKHAKLKRTTLDCGHANAGDVHYHYWCDRLSCSSACADAPHDCGEFKGTSSIEAEAVEPEAVVDPPAPRPLTLSPETYRALYGEPVAVASSGWSGFAATMPYEAAELAPPAPHVDELEAPATAAWQTARPGDTPGELVPGEADTPQPIDAVELVEPDPDIWVKTEPIDPRPWWRRMLPGGTR